MQKLDYIRRMPWISDFNSLVDKVNEIITKLNTKIEIEEVTISKQVKDFSFFKWEETKLPYHAQYTITSVEEASKIFEAYTFLFKEMKQINDLIIQWKIVSLIIDVTEEITERDEKQETIFETVEAVTIDELNKANKKESKSGNTTPKKRWRKKKSEWSK